MAVAPYSQQYNWALDILLPTRLGQAIVSGAITVAGQVLSAGSYDLAAYQLRQALAANILTKGTSAYFAQFAAAVAANATIAADLSNAVPVLIAASTQAMPSVVTTSSAHGLATGNIVEILGHLVNTAIVGLWQVTVISTTTFSVPVPGNGVGGATGTVTLQPPDADLDTAVAAVWSAVAGVTSAT